MISAQHARCRRVAKLALAWFENAVCGKETQYAAQRFRVYVDRNCQLGGRSRDLVQLICNGKVRDDVQAPGQAVTSRHLSQDLEWTGPNHMNFSCLAIDDVLRCK